MKRFRLVRAEFNVGFTFAVLTAEHNWFWWQTRVAHVVKELSKYGHYVWVYAGTNVVVRTELRSFILKSEAAAIEAIKTAHADAQWYKPGRLPRAKLLTLPTRSMLEDAINNA